MLDLKPIEARLAAAPELDPYATAVGGVVLLNGPFPYAKAYAAVELVKHAPTDIAALIREVRHLRAAIQDTYTAPNAAAFFAAERALREAVKGEDNHGEL